MKTKTPNHENIHYGELVEVASLIDNKGNRDFKAGHYTGVKVHYFNKKGVFLGNIYEFVTYDKVRFREDSPSWCRYFMRKKNGKYRNKYSEMVLQTIFETTCRIVTRLIRMTYKD